MEHSCEKCEGLCREPLMPMWRISDVFVWNPHAFWRRFLAVSSWKSHKIRGDADVGRSVSPRIFGAVARMCLPQPQMWGVECSGRQTAFGGECYKLGLVKGCRKTAVHNPQHSKKDLLHLFMDPVLFSRQGVCTPICSSVRGGWSRHCRQARAFSVFALM